MFQSHCCLFRHFPYNSISMPPSEEEFEPYGIDDFRRIQEETSRASARLTEMRKEIKERLDHILPGSGQSALSALAHDLSPSSFSASPVVNFPIHTPLPSLGFGYHRHQRADSFDGSDNSGSEIPVDAVADHLGKGLTRVLKEFEESVNEKILILKSENQKNRELQESIAAMLAESEKEITSKVSSSMKSLLNNYRESHEELREIVVEEGLELLRRKEEIQQRKMNETKQLLLSNKMDSITSSIKAQFHGELEQIKTVLQSLNEEKNNNIQNSHHINHVKQDISLQIQNGINSLAREFQDQFENHGGQIHRSPSPYMPRSTTADPSGIVEENVKLRGLVRKMKLALSKWRIDYLSNIPSNRPVNTPTPHIDHGVVVVGEDFATLSDNLMRMWTAVTPSGQELIQFLVNIEAAVDSKGKIPLMSVYDYECKKNIEKLPIAKLAAQREFLLSREGHVTQEIHDIQTELLEKILQFEQKYEQKFIFRSDDDEDYTQVIHNTNDTVADVTHN